MKTSVQNLLHLSNAEDYNGHKLTIDIIYSVVMFLFSFIGWYPSIVAHTLLLLWITLSTYQLSVIHEQKNCESIFVFSKYSMFQKCGFYFCAAFLQSAVCFVLLLAHMLIFLSFSPITLIVGVIHFLFALCTGLGLGRLIRKFHIGLVCILLYYFITVFMTFGSIWEVEHSRYTSIALQMMNFERFNWINNFCLVTISILFLVVMYVLMERAIKMTFKRWVALFTAIALVTSVYPYEFYRNSQIRNVKTSEYILIAGEEKNIEYYGISEKDARNLSQIVLDLGEGMKQYGYTISGDKLKFVKVFATPGLYPKAVEWDGDKFVFNVFSDLLFSDEPDILSIVIGEYISTLLSRSGAATMNLIAYDMKAILHQYCINYALENGKSKRLSNQPVYEFERMESFPMQLSDFVLRKYPEQFRDIYESINLSEIHNDEHAKQILNAKFPEIMREFEVDYNV